MKFTYNDGGRVAAGFKTATARDCVARSVAIASGLPYSEVYERLAKGNATQRKSKRSGRSTGSHTASEGINTSRKWFSDYMAEIGFVWVPTMKVGSGCRVHLREGELPMGRLVVNVSRHYTAVIDGVMHDTADCSRGGTRCVYGYWIMCSATGT